MLNYILNDIKYNNDCDINVTKMGNITSLNYKKYSIISYPGIVSYTLFSSIKGSSKTNYGTYLTQEFIGIKN